MADPKRVRKARRAAAQRARRARQAAASAQRRTARASERQREREAKAAAQQRAREDKAARLAAREAARGAGAPVSLEEPPPVSSIAAPVESEPVPVTSIAAPVESEPVAETAPIAEQVPAPAGPRPRRSIRSTHPWLWEIAAVVAHIALVVAVVFPCFLAYEVWGTSTEADHSQHSLAATFDREIAHPRTTVTGREPAPGSPLALIQIPSIGASLIVVEGVSPSDLRLGPGHYPGTALPGHDGNVAIAGHRVAYLHPFYYLNDLAPTDRVILRTPTDVFVYRVTSVAVVSPTASSVIAPSTTDMVTLTTTNPVFGSSTRLAVRATIATIDGEAVGPTARFGAPSRPTSPAASDLAGTAGSVLPVELFGSVLVLLCVACRVGVRRFGARSTYLVAIPLMALAGAALVIAINSALPASI